MTEPEKKPDPYMEWLKRESPPYTMNPTVLMRLAWNAACAYMRTLTEKKDSQP